MLYTYYGDDFTGSTDVLEQLGANGIPAVLFIGVPSPAVLAKFPDVHAIGIAGDSRSRSPEWMSANLPAIFRVLKQFNAPVTHYKVCSTFDSSPSTGNIGRAIEVGFNVFAESPVVPIVVGAPHLRRFVTFGNLFAGAPDGTVQRIDHHPMSRHPVTPMHEADLRRHLGEQTQARIGLMDLPALQSSTPANVLDTLIAADHRAVVFDTVDAASLAAIGGLVWERAQQHPMFCVGSSGLTAALVTRWKSLALTASANSERVARKGPLLVVSGSCSPATERQLHHALAHGYRGIPIDPVALLDPINSVSDTIMKVAAQSLAQGRDTILYTALGMPKTPAHGDELGIALGKLLAGLLAAPAAAVVRRVLICGGDTSSHLVQQLGIHALTWVANIQAGAPLCRACADSQLDGLELILKGGQMGTPDFFDHARGM